MTGGSREAETTMPLQYLCELTHFINKGSHPEGDSHQQHTHNKQKAGGDDDGPSGALGQVVVGRRRSRSRRRSGRRSRCSGRRGRLARRLPPPPASPPLAPRPRSVRDDVVAVVGAEAAAVGAQAAAVGVRQQRTGPFRRLLVAPLQSEVLVKVDLPEKFTKLCEKQD